MMIIKFIVQKIMSITERRSDHEYITLTKKVMMKMKRNNFFKGNGKTLTRILTLTLIVIVTFFN
jgi:hypothetical protein